MDNFATILLWIVMIAGAIGIRLVVGSLDRQRIREHIENNGGRVLEIAWNPFGPGWFGSRERIYDVTYEFGSNAPQSATCKTSMFGGIYWTSGLTERQETSGTPAEPIVCLDCGSQIAAGKSHCPHCGWSYLAK